MLPRHLQQIRYPGENPLSSLKRLIPPHLLLEKHQYVSLRPFQDASLQSVSRLSIFKPERRLVTVTLIGLHDALKGAERAVQERLSESDRGVRRRRPSGDCTRQVLYESTLKTFGTWASPSWSRISQGIAH
jgi:hypothetical protein